MYDDQNAPEVRKERLISEDFTGKQLHSCVTMGQTISTRNNEGSNHTYLQCTTTKEDK
jgi:hypothetical protein